MYSYSHWRFRLSLEIETEIQMMKVTLRQTPRRTETEREIPKRRVKEKQTENYLHFLTDFEKQKPRMTEILKETLTGLERKTPKN